MSRALILLLLMVAHTILQGQGTEGLKNTLPDAGRPVGDKPVGKGWVNLLASIDDWNAEKEFWDLDKGSLRAEADNEKLHHEWRH